MSLLPAIAGVVLIGVVLREVFSTLFHPTGQPRLTTAVFRAVWVVTGRLGSKARRLSGPLSMVLVIAVWATILIVGWALVYLPALPEEFIFASPLDAGRQDDLGTAVYFSWVTQATLGYGDIAPESQLLRILAPLQATIGFGVFTLVVTWVLSVYPALQRLRSTASFAHALQRAHERSPAPSSGAHLVRQMERLAEALNAARVDFLQYPSTFYFAAPATTLGLAGALPFMLDLADRHHASPDAAAAASELSASLELLAATLAEEHLGMAGADAADTLRAFRDHYGA
jgi:hypothetical protein